MHARVLLSIGLLLLSVMAGAAPLSAWPEVMVAARTAVLTGGDPVATGLALYREHPIACDWFLQDTGGDKGIALWFSPREESGFEEALLARVVETLEQPEGWRARCAELKAAQTLVADPAWLALYIELCEARRAQRLAPLLAAWPELIFTKHALLGGSHYAYTEGQSDAQRERHFVPGSGLYRLRLKGLYAEVKPLLEDPEGLIRDPDVSWDGKRVLFAWKKSDREDDFHLYELTLEDGAIRQLTFGKGVADYEGVYLPNGDILFNSTRCIQTVDCWWTEVSNLYACDADGRHMRRLSFDQVHTNFPTVTQDGRVLYTRWDYNDRGQIYPQPLFQMNPDGTAQMEYYGGNSWFPTTIIHARDIPNSPKIMAILTGHHTYQRGKLAWIDVRKGRQEAAGVQLIAPIRPTPAEKIDRYGQNGEQFQYPYPLDEGHFLITYSPIPGDAKQPVIPYGVYFMDADGQRELLVSDPIQFCSQPIPLIARPAVHERPSLVDYAKTEGTYYLQDIYTGPGLAGVERGSIERLRVVALDYRAAGVGDNRNQGPAGGALVSTPVAVGNGTWDVKRVLGETPVYADGSAFFTVPARTPVYFQAIDQQGYVAQTMRSWSTLQPGEAFSCVGCHEYKSETATALTKKTLAMRAGPQPLKDFYGPARGFSYPKEIQPIWDKHCIACHADSEAKPVPGQMKAAVSGETVQAAFSLLGEPVLDSFSKRHWAQSYLTLLQVEAEFRGKPSGYIGQSNAWVNWIGTQSVPSLLPPYAGGAAKSGLMTLLKSGHGGVSLSREEWEKIACWIDLYVPYCGDYKEAAAWSAEESAYYDHFLKKRSDLEVEERENLVALLGSQNTAVVETTLEASGSD